MPACASARCSGSVAYPVRASARISPGGVPAASASAIWAVTQFASANSFGNTRTRTRPPAPRIAISAFGARRSLWLTHLTAASRISDARAEVAPEHDLRVAWMALVEAEDVPRVGVAPAVDQLVVVADHAQVPVRAGEQVDEHRLRVAGVLELVGQDPPPSLPQPREPVRML